MSRAQEAFGRGMSDASTGRCPIFRSTKARGIVAELDDPMSDDWTDAMRAAYLEGYNAPRIGDRVRIRRGICGEGLIFTVSWLGFGDREAQVSGESYGPVRLSEVEVLP